MYEWLTHPVTLICLVVVIAWFGIGYFLYKTFNN